MWMASDSWTIYITSRLLSQFHKSWHILMLQWVLATCRIGVHTVSSNTRSWQLEESCLSTLSCRHHYIPVLKTNPSAEEEHCFLTRVVNKSWLKRWFNTNFLMHVFPITCSTTSPCRLLTLNIQDLPSVPQAQKHWKTKHQCIRLQILSLEINYGASLHRFIDDLFFSTRINK